MAVPNVFVNLSRHGQLVCTQWRMRVQQRSARRRGRVCVFPKHYTLSSKKKYLMYRVVRSISAYDFWWAQKEKTFIQGIVDFRFQSKVMAEFQFQQTKATQAWAARRSCTESRSLDNACECWNLIVDKRLCNVLYVSASSVCTCTILSKSYAIFSAQPLESPWHVLQPFLAEHPVVNGVSTVLLLELEFTTVFCSDFPDNTHPNNARAEVLSSNPARGLFCAHQYACHVYVNIRSLKRRSAKPHTMPQVM